MPPPRLRPGRDVEPGDHLPVTSNAEGQGVAVEDDDPKREPLFAATLRHAASPALPDRRCVLGIETVQLVECR
jgi:hypothetical protein